MSTLPGEDATPGELQALLERGAGLLLAVHDRDIDDLDRFSPRRVELKRPGGDSA